MSDSRVREEIQLESIKPPKADDEAPGAEPARRRNDGDALAMSQTVSGPPYSVFPRRTKMLITVFSVVGSFISPTTANIYFPALNPISEDLGVSIGLINLTLTSYMIFQGLSPTFFGDFGDQAGRRPAYIVAFTIYLCANIGLAVQRDYAALMVLRCLQSAGSSGTIALGYAMIADISSPAERGKYMGFVQCGINIGPALGPTLGGLLSQYLGWASIFWFLAIFVTCWLVPWILFVPESGRNVVGNGSVIPQRSVNRTLVNLIRRRSSPWQQEKATTKRKIRFPNPLKTLVVVRDKESLLIILTCSFIYLQFILIAATLGTQFKAIYGYNDLQVGLCYLPYGAGCCVATLAQGYIVDWNFRRISNKMGRKVDRKKGMDLIGFPIESVRIQPMYPALTIGILVVVSYGWCLHQEVTVAAPLVLLFLVGMCVTSSFSVLGTLLVDIYPESPATATAALNLVRCMFGAAATSIIEYMLKGMGRGWCYTFLGLISVACMPVLRLIQVRGVRWREEKRAREEKKAIDQQHRRQDEEEVRSTASVNET